VTRCSGAKTASVLPKKAPSTKYSPPKKLDRPSKNAPTSTIQAKKKHHRPPKIADLAL